MLTLSLLIVVGIIFWELDCIRRNTDPLKRGS
jgi:hypothetical protein